MSKARFAGKTNRSAASRYCLGVSFLFVRRQQAMACMA
jgi:hypothetical protein